VNEVYQQLKNDGVEFPPLDLDTFAPISTPFRPEGGSQQVQERPSQQQPSSSHQVVGGASPRGGGRPIRSLKPEQIAKLLSELDVVRRNLDVMNEILVENEPGKESEDDYSLMQELNTTMRSMQERVTILIGRVQDEIVMESLLQINDELNGCFTRYDRHMKNRKAAAANVSGNETSFTDPVID
ncbi:PREDICTED: TOM1-like protein 2, partial [Amphimedon queenslandica]